MVRKNLSKRNPKLKIAKLLLKYVPKTLMRKKFPQWAYIYITRKCNLKCSYCYSTSNEMSEMSGQEIISAVDKIHELGARYVSFFGGEPTLRREELIQAIKHASLEKGMFTQLPTNGTLLDKIYLNDLGKAGLDMLDISLDGLREITGSKKDLSHRKGLFEAIKESRDKYGFAVKANHVITPQNYESLDEVLEFTKENGILASIMMACPPVFDKSKYNEQFYFSNKPEHIDIVESISKKLIIKKKQGYKTSEPIEFYQSMPRFVRGEKGVWKCDSPTYNLTIDSDGMMKLCGTLACGQGDLGMHFSELDKNYYKKFRKESEGLLSRCNDKCLAAAYFCSNNYRKHPIKFATNVISKDRKNSTK